MDAFQKFGFSEAEADIIQDVLLTADLYGIESHGMQRMVRYHKCIEKGMIQIDAKPETVSETLVSAVIDAHDAMGQLVGHAAMNMGSEKRRGNRYCAQFQPMLKWPAKTVCWVLAAQTLKPLLFRLSGARPCWDLTLSLSAMPAEPYDFLFDASTTVVTRGKLEMYNKMEKPLPENWALNKDGLPFIDAPDVLANIASKKGGGILPLGGSTELAGGHKGYGYGMICEIFSSILSLGATSNYCMTGGKGNICHGFMAIDLGCFGDADEIKKTPLHISAGAAGSSQG